MLDINSPEFAKQLSNIIRDIVNDELEKMITNLRFEAVGKVATSGNSATINCYINNSPTAVPVKNPRGFSLTAGQLVAVVYPNFNENLKYIDRIL